MNDITKARYYLKAVDSDLQHLESFGLMLLTAENDYKEIKRTQKSDSVLPGELDDKEVDAAVDYAALRYLKKHNQLPGNVSDLFAPRITSQEKLALAQQWFNA